MSAYRRTYSGQNFDRRRCVGMIAIAAACALLIVEATDHAALSPLRALVAAWSEPIIARGARTVEPVRVFVARVAETFFNADEITRLRAETTRLKAAAIRLEAVERENRDLVALLRLSTGPASTTVAARVIAVSPDLVSAAITIGVGRDQGVGIGDPVVADGVLFGRVVRVGAATATLVRLVDARSRVPVVVGAQQVRAVLTGDGTREPQLDHISPDAIVRDGDGVTTSGVGGIVARGLVVGRVIRDTAGWRVQLPGGQDTPRVVAVVRFPSPGDDAGGRVDVGQGDGQGLSLLERRRMANRARVGGPP